MDDGGGEPGKLMEKRVVGILGDVVGLRHAAAVADRDAHFGVEVVADPSDSDLIHPFDPGYGGEDPRDLVDQTRVDGVHESLVDHRSPRCAALQDHRRDGEAHDRVGQLPAESHAAAAGEDRRRHEGIGAGVATVGDKRGRADCPPDRRWAGGG